MKLPEKLSHLENKYGEPTSIEELFAMLKGHVEEIYALSDQERESIAALAEALLGNDTNHIRKTIATEIANILSKNGQLTKFQTDISQWCGKKIERYYEDDLQQEQFSLRCAAVLQRGAELLEYVTPRLWGVHANEIYKYLDENIAKSDIIPVYSIAYLRGFLLTHIRGENPVGVERLLSQTLISKEDILLLAVEAHDAKQMPYSGIGPFLINYSLEHCTEASLIHHLSQLKSKLEEALSRPNTIEHFSNRFSDYLQLLEEWQRIVSILLSPGEVKKKVGILKAK